jgi:hypothetical protein
MNGSNTHKKVLNALLHPKYHWRTISGIVKESHLPQDEVASILNEFIREKKVRKSVVPDAWGNDLFGLVLRVDELIEEKSKI